MKNNKTLGLCATIDFDISEVLIKPISDSNFSTNLLKLLKGADLDKVLFLLEPVYREIGEYKLLKCSQNRSVDYVKGKVIALKITNNLNFTSGRNSRLSYKDTSVYKPMLSMLGLQQNLVDVSDFFLICSNTGFYLAICSDVEKEPFKIVSSLAMFDRQPDFKNYVCNNIIQALNGTLSPSFTKLDKEIKLIIPIKPPINKGDTQLISFYNPSKLIYLLDLNTTEYSISDGYIRLVDSLCYDTSLKTLNNKVIYSKTNFILKPEELYRYYTNFIDATYLSNTPYLGSNVMQSIAKKDNLPYLTSEPKIRGYKHKLDFKSSENILGKITSLKFYTQLKTYIKENVINDYDLIYLLKKNTDVEGFNIILTDLNSFVSAERVSIADNFWLIRLTQDGKFVFKKQDDCFYSSDSVSQQALCYSGLTSDESLKTDFFLLPTKMGYLLVSYNSIRTSKMYGFNIASPLAIFKLDLQFYSYVVSNVIRVLNDGLSDYCGDLICPSEAPLSYGDNAFYSYYKPMYLKNLVDLSHLEKELGDFIIDDIYNDSELTSLGGELVYDRGSYIRKNDLCEPISEPTFNFFKERNLLLHNKENENKKSVDLHPTKDYSLKESECKSQIKLETTKENNTLVINSPSYIDNLIKFSKEPFCFMDVRRPYKQLLISKTDFLSNIPPSRKYGTMPFIIFATREVNRYSTSFSLSQHIREYLDINNFREKFNKNRDDDFPTIQKSCLYNSHIGVKNIFLGFTEERLVLFTLDKGKLLDFVKIINTSALYKEITYILAEISSSLSKECATLLPKEFFQDTELIDKYNGGIIQDLIINISTPTIINSQVQENKIFSTNPDTIIEDLTSILLLAIVHEDKVIGYRFKLPRGYMDIDIETAKKYGVRGYRCTQKVTVEPKNGLLLSSSEIKHGVVFPEISDRLDLIEILFKNLIQG